MALILIKFADPQLDALLGGGPNVNPRLDALLQPGQANINPRLDDVLLGNPAGQAPQIPIAPYNPELPQDATQAPKNFEQQSFLGRNGPRIAADLGLWGAADIGVKRVAKPILANQLYNKSLSRLAASRSAKRLGVDPVARRGASLAAGRALNTPGKALLKFPKGYALRAPTLTNMGIGTLVNTGFDAADYAGLYSMDNSKDELAWWKHKRDAEGNLIPDKYGNPEGGVAWNPSAIGHWNMKPHQKSTTPNDYILDDMQTGNPNLDRTLSYGTAALSSYMSPAKSYASLHNFGNNEANPIMSGDTLQDWRNVRDQPNKGRFSQSDSQSVPLIMAQNIASGVGQPNRLARSQRLKEMKIWKDSGKYHPVYNPTGRGDNSELPHASRWLSDPVNQTHNFGESVKTKGLFPTLGDAWLRNW